MMPLRMRRESRMQSAAIACLHLLIDAEYAEFTASRPGRKKASSSNVEPGGGR